ncbi:TauD/TfdA family dioxygenase [Cognatishimia sp. MH4019]|uniref:TauD/TfdA family dioxygenase n=1 Tax=Cognatishimia sp. MH4019 TaxID=2854030 RepID=UPI001CD28160|nr:TauD/TfdA family dioxygenase [Cognatishimia sp. MH4019]
MKDLSLPLTPDFDTWPVTAQIKAATILPGGHIELTWSDGRIATYHRLLLAENATDADTLHPLSRETLKSPLDFPEGLKATKAEIAPSGALEISWSDGTPRGAFHPGWLYAHGWTGTAPATPKPILWRAADLPEPATVSGRDALQDDRVFHKFLTSLRDHGVARLEGLPQQDGLLVEIAERIGTIRETNFGRTYTLAIQDDPTSNAYTPVALPQHMDLCTRECPPGLQFLYCRANDTSGGDGLYCDGYRIAEDIRAEEPDTWEAMTTIPWTYNNRAKTTSYKASGPMVDLDEKGQIAALRYETWLRAPLVADLATQDRAYTAYRRFAERAQSDAYLMRVRYKPGDLFAFDNRRVLHGRSAYDAAGGARFIEGVYADRDDLYSAIRVIERRLTV